MNTTEGQPQISYMPFPQLAPVNMSVNMSGNMLGNMNEILIRPTT
jgi:hypothetical protein